MSSSEQVEFSDENSDESPLSSSPEYEIEHESDRAFASSSKKGITCSDIPLASSFWLLQQAATQIVGIFFPHNR